jgi:hypothetical protein
VERFIPCRADARELASLACLVSRSIHSVIVGSLSFAQEKEIGMRRRHGNADKFDDYE